MIVNKITDKYMLSRLFDGYGRGDKFSLVACDKLLEILDSSDPSELVAIDPVNVACIYDEETPEDIMHNYAICGDFEDLGNAYEDNEINVDVFLAILSRRTVCYKLSNGKILYRNF